jgi:hypothetical protein
MAVVEYLSRIFHTDREKYLTCCDCMVSFLFHS